jgi:hypothetical protein
MSHGGRTRAARLARHGAVSTALALLSDRRLRALVDAAPVLATGIGGSTLLVEVGGTPVFVKRVPLTALEARPEHVRSTANLFGLPTFYQYGVGSAGFGAWRELAAHVMTTDWVLAGEWEAAPLLHHHRVLAGPPAGEPDAAELDRSVAYWHGSAAVRARLEALAQAPAAVLLFLEYLPHNLHEWLTGRAAAGGEALDAACAMVERDLRAGVAAMNERGLLHFDAHFRNILTDGGRLYFADLGLAVSPRFELSAAERDFLARNASHDAAYAVTQLVNWLVTALSGTADRDAYIRRCAGGGDPVGLPASAAAVVLRHAPVAAVVNAFYRKLYGESRTTPYPLDAVPD